MSEKGVILLSGGLDSATVLAYAIKRGFQLTALTFNYGQRHSRENNSARDIASRYGIDLKEAKINLSDLIESSLTGYGNVEHRRLADIESRIPNTYVPARNIIMISIAAGLCQTIEASTIFIGANALDYSGYPDCRPEFFNSMEQSINIGTGSDGKDRIRIEVPLQYLRKSEIINMGIKLNVPYELTWSCYEGGDEACGMCDSCQLRLRGFMEAGVHDPIKYSKYPEFYKK
ncbi:MAG: 7-cyano-7-deazaguanine synthase QueC [Thermoplasmataceae archaeon]|jgi:7-cyano-7-deazaguanine synthase